MVLLLLLLLLLPVMLLLLLPVLLPVLLLVLVRAQAMKSRRMHGRTSVLRRRIRPKLPSMTRQTRSVKHAWSSFGTLGDSLTLTRTLTNRNQVVRSTIALFKRVAWVQRQMYK